MACNHFGSELFFVANFKEKESSLTLYVTIVNLVCDIALVHHDHYLPVSDGALAILNCGTLLLTGCLANLGDKNITRLALFVLITSSVVVSHFCSLLVEHCCSMIVS